MLYLTFDVSEEGLEQQVFLVDYRLVVENGLHSLMIALVRIHSKSLELLLVLAVVENCLRKHYICVYFEVEISKGRPLSGRFNLKRV